MLHFSEIARNSHNLDIIPSISHAEYQDLMEQDLMLNSTRLQEENDLDNLGWTKSENQETAVATTCGPALIYGNDHVLWLIVSGDRAFSSVGLS